MTGVIVLDKPQAFTSFDAVAVLRGLTREKKTGHTGTLDPMATGVLPMLLGRATKAASLLPDTGKAYRASFRLGVKTDTGDIWGETQEEQLAFVSREAMEQAIKPLRGDILQLPPMYSAVSVNGQRLYDLARRGIEVEREKRPVRVESFNLLDFDGTEGTLEIRCSKGTYIRTLIEDMAAGAGTIGTMTALRRTWACGFSMEQAHSLDRLREMKAAGTIEDALLPLEDLFAEYPDVFVSEAQEQRFLNGGSLDLGRLKLPRITLRDEDLLRVCREQFLGLARVNLAEGQLKFVKHFYE